MLSPLINVVNISMKSYFLKILRIFGQLQAHIDIIGSPILKNGLI